MIRLKNDLFTFELGPKLRLSDELTKFEFKPSGLYIVYYASFISTTYHGVLGFWGFGVLGLGFRV